MKLIGKAGSRWRHFIGWRILRYQARKKVIKDKNCPDCGKLIWNGYFCCDKCWKKRVKKGIYKREVFGT